MSYAPPRLLDASKARGASAIEQQLQARNLPPPPWLHIRRQNGPLQQMAPSHSGSASNSWGKSETTE